MFHVPCISPTNVTLLSYLTYQTIAKFLSLFFPVKSSTPLCHLLRPSHAWAKPVTQYIYKQMYLMCNWCAIPTPTVCMCVSGWESLRLCDLLNLPTTTAVCSCVCMSLCHWVWLISCALTFCVTQSICDNCLLLCVCHLDWNSLRPHVLNWIIVLFHPLTTEV